MRKITTDSPQQTKHRPIPKIKIPMTGYE